MFRVWTQKRQRRRDDANRNDGGWMADGGMNVFVYRDEWGGCRPTHRRRIRHLSHKRQPKNKHIGRPNTKSAFISRRHRARSEARMSRCPCTCLCVRCAVSFRMSNNRTETTQKSKLIRKQMGRVRIPSSSILKPISNRTT